MASDDAEWFAPASDEEADGADGPDSEIVVPMLAASPMARCSSKSLRPNQAEQKTPNQRPNAKQRDWWHVSQRVVLSVPAGRLW